MALDGTLNTHLTRRELLRNALSLTAIGLTSACSPFQKETPTPVPAKPAEAIKPIESPPPHTTSSAIFSPETKGYSMKEENGLTIAHLLDPAHPFLTGLHASFNTEWDNGSGCLELDCRIRPQVPVDSDVLYRIIVEEQSPFFGGLVNKLYITKPRLIRSIPVIRFAKGDREKVLLKFLKKQDKNSCKDTYGKMDSYEFFRRNDGTIAGKYLGIEMITQDQIKPRDKEAEGFWFPDCDKEFTPDKTLNP